MVLEQLKDLKGKLDRMKEEKNGGLAGTGLFANTPETPFAQKPEAEVGPYKGITGGAGFQEDEMERMIQDEEAKKIYRKELARQLAREKKRQVKELAKKKAKERARAPSKHDVGRDLIETGKDIAGEGPQVDIIGDGGGQEGEIPLI